ncbi:hypothetical protein CHS0354_036219 [Potamilus streckersoni]|uniref:Thyrotropin-releasing hormone receptor n=1 Tax=Potamilus streckersoni TaxID=2493646 RepID=A0AAE0SVJ7_9BIVA|nr:hypothetical protein CHS0354_036219 [Potamilus streckersoni]
MLVVIVAVFGTTWLPYRMTVVYNSLAKERYMDNWFWLFCRTMIYINSAINPVLYNAMSIKFRRAIRRLLCCGKSLSRRQLAIFHNGHKETKGADGNEGCGRKLRTATP